MDSQVHPLDSNSTPYNFSSTTSPLLHKAARALNLPARSPHSYVSLASSSSSSESLPPVEEKYTGQILVSSYHVSYILPREFPRREADTRSKRQSIVAHFMAAIDIWAPFISQPPHAPYLVSFTIYVKQVHMLNVYAVVYPCAPLSVQPHQAEDISSQDAEDIFIPCVPIFCRRRLRFLGSDL